MKNVRNWDRNDFAIIRDKHKKVLMIKVRLKVERGGKEEYFGNLLNVRMKEEVDVNMIGLERVNWLFIYWGTKTFSMKEFKEEVRTWNSEKVAGLDKVTGEIIKNGWGD